jgi:hypothetical protein
MSPRHLPLLSRSSVTVGLAALALNACVEGEENDGSPSVPTYQGALPAGSTPSGSASSGAVSSGGSGGASGSAGASNAANAPSSSASEQTMGAIPFPGVGGTGAGNAPSGTGGSGSPAATGAGGAAPVSPAGGAGGASVGAAGSAPAEPPVPEPPVLPPPDPFPAPTGPGCGTGAFFCEDFEDFAVGPAQQNAKWRPEGNASIDAQAMQGARALRLQPGGGQFARIALVNFSAPDNSLFGRMFLRVEAQPTSPNFAHWVVVEATGSGSSERVRPLGGQFVDLQDRALRSNFWGVGADGGPTGDWTAWDNGGLVEARSATWQCIEWRMHDADSAIDVWIDEAFQPSLSVSRDDNPRNVPFVFPTFNNMTIGWGVFQGGTTPAQFDVHVDDIVLSRERAGCN